MSDDMTMIPKKRYEEYFSNSVNLKNLKVMVAEAETIEDLIAALKINGVEVNEDLCRLVR